MSRLARLASAASLSCSLACSTPPTDFNDCILQNVKSGMTAGAVQLVREACTSKFPDSAPLPPSPLPIEDLPIEGSFKITGKFGPDAIDSSAWSGTIYNGNHDWQIEEVALLVMEDAETAKAKLAKGEEHDVEKYIVRVSVPPLSSSRFSMTVNWPDQRKYSWMFGLARGRRAEP